MKKLKDIITCDYDIPINDIKTDSREVTKNDLFVAIKGYYVDHSLYIEDAIKNGASAVVTDKDYQSNIPIIKVDDVDKELVDICRKFYNFDEQLKLIAVTGTDGKTTTATMIKKILNKYVKTSYMGTNGIEIDEEKINISNTTPEIEKIYKYFDLFTKEKIKNVSMEVSSEALLHKRVDNLKFKYIIYTNITEDHLNVHKTIDNYINTKMKLIDLIKLDGIIIINNDDLNQQQIKKRKIPNLYTYGKSEDSDFMIKDIISKQDITYFTIKYKNQEFQIESSMIGEYNIYNLTAAFIVAYLENIDAENIIKEIKEIKEIEGRGEKLNFGQDYTIILDYAHTENGIKNIIDSVKNKYKKIIVVTGSAGGREKEKRSKIGKFLLDNADLVVFTMDDPRYEKVDDIIDDMIKDTNKNNFVRINSRKEAIKYALKEAKKEEVVLILGKGRDNYMAIEDRKESYCDYIEIKKYFQN